MRWPQLVIIAGFLLLTACAPLPAGSPALPPATALPSAQTAGATGTAAPLAPPPGATTAPTPTAAARGTATPTAARPPASQGAPGGSGLFLEVVEPAAETLDVAGDTQRVAVAGRTRPGAVVSVDGELVLLDQSGGFRTEVPLEGEVTVVEVVASDTSGAEVRAQRVVVRN